MFKIGSILKIQNGNAEVLGKIIGIDEYRLDAFNGKTVSWDSYTLISQSGRSRRFWCVRWSPAKWILWKNAKLRKASADMKLMDSRSGIAHIKFKGDSGVSTPNAALIHYKSKDQYFCMERFLGSDAMFFSGRKIPAPKSAKRD